MMNNPKQTQDWSSLVHIYTKTKNYLSQKTNSSNYSLSTKVALKYVSQGKDSAGFD